MQIEIAISMDLNGFYCMLHVLQFSKMVLHGTDQYEMIELENRPS